MKPIRSRLCHLSLTMCLLGSFSATGCGSSPDLTIPQPITEEDKARIIAVLPPGVTLDSPIKADPNYGTNSKTVGEALASLHAHVRDGKIHDGVMGQLILFEVGGKKPSTPKAVRGKQQESTSTIVVTGG